MRWSLYAMYLDISPVDSLVARLAQIPRREDEALLLMIGERDCPDLSGLVNGLNRAGIPFFGGVFPGLIAGSQRLDRGLLATALPLAAPLFVSSGLGSEDPELPESWAPEEGDGAKQTAIVLVDGLAANISGFLGGLFSLFGSSLHYFGGGAGYIDFVQRPCLICPEGIYQDAAIVGLVSLESQLGVKHGWKRVGGPLVATRTDRNVIHELNWRPAFEVYRSMVEPLLGTDIHPESFFEVSKGFPFGIFREGEEDVVRDPISVGEGGELVCVGAVPENTVLNLLRGDAPSLIAAAGQAAQAALTSNGRVPHAALVADCVSRVLFLEEAFSEELQALCRADDHMPDVEFEGVLSLGEISSYGDGLLEFFNKTIVAGALYA